ncbi:MAG TPA: hypothetical protein VGI67_09850 [Thermoleophilaceae bacterium]|jgi:hypothetical protein
MRFRKTVLAFAAVAAIGFSATAGAHNLGRGDITGYPKAIRMVDLNGYQIVTKYTLGRNTGNTFQQNYLAGGQVSATGLAGPFTGQTFASKYIAMPVGHKMLMITWYTDDGTLTDVFVMNFRSHIVSDVAPDKAPQSLGTLDVIKRGGDRIP